MPNQRRHRLQRTQRLSSLRLERWLAAVLVAVAVVGAPSPARAVIVDRLVADFDPTQVNTTAPGTDLTFESSGVEDDDPTTVAGGDPGWFNVPTNRSGIYLGNQWYLDARHAIGNGIQNINLNGETYTEIPGTRFTVQNPGTFRGVSMTANSDLVLFRLNTNSNSETPEQANANVRTLDNADADRLLAIADGTHTQNSDVLMIGHSNQRVINTADEDGHFQFDSNTWAESPTGAESGFRQVATRTKTWGTNTIANDSGVEENSSGNPLFDANNDLVVDINGRFIVTQLTRFDEGSNDAQGAAGDSGGPVFVRNSQGDWELGGVMHGIALEDGQPGNISAFGNHTFFTDIGNPLTTYRQQILDAYDDDYSVMGDVDLDGDVDMDDLTALAAGWNDPVAEAGILTWKKGDLDQNGDTDLADFALLRAQLPSAVTLADLNAAIAGVSGISPVPEPAGGLLAAAASAAFLAGRRGRRR